MALSLVWRRLSTPICVTTSLQFASCQLARTFLSWHRWNYDKYFAEFIPNVYFTSNQMYGPHRVDWSWKAADIEVVQGPSVRFNILTSFF